MALDSGTLYTSPAWVRPPAQCAVPSPVSSLAHVVILNNLTGTVVDRDNTTRATSMCAVANEYTFGVTDWVMLSLPFVHRETSARHRDLAPSIVLNPSLDNTSLTTAQLHRLVLAVDAAEATLTARGGDDHDAATRSSTLHILLDGVAPRGRTTHDGVDEAAMTRAESDADPMVYYPWRTYASALSYRRIRYEHPSPPRPARGGDTADANSTLVEPFHFALIPGSLLRNTSRRIRVPMSLTASIRFTTYANETGPHTTPPRLVQVDTYEETFLYKLTISRAVSAQIRFDADAFAPPLTAPRSGGLGRTSATTVLVLLGIALLAVLAVWAYVEWTYRQIIHRAKYYPTRPEGSTVVPCRRAHDGRREQPHEEGAGRRQAGQTCRSGEDWARRNTDPVLPRASSRDAGAGACPPSPPPAVDTRWGWWRRATVVFCHGSEDEEEERMMSLRGKHGGRTQYGVVRVETARVAQDVTEGDEPHGPIGAREGVSLGDVGEEHSQDVTEVQPPLPPPLPTTTTTMMTTTHGGEEDREGAFALYLRRSPVRDEDMRVSFDSVEEAQVDE